jgi:hypothetical protein
VPVFLFNIPISLFPHCSVFCPLRLSDPLQYQSIVDAEWNIIYDKLDKCVKSGAKIVLSRLAIGDLATQVCTPLQDIILSFCFHSLSLNCFSIAR